MPWTYTNPRNVIAPVATSVPTTEARIERITLSAPASEGSNRYEMEVGVTGGKIVAGTFVGVERVNVTFTDAEVRAILSGGLGAQLETALLTAARAAGKLPAGTLT